MREIEFRVYLKDENKIKYFKKGERFIDLNGSYYCIIYNLSNHRKAILSKEKDDNCILIQYTGLKDKNEEKLYEYDLIAHYENGSICSPRGVIIFNDGSFKAKFVGGKSYTILNQRTTRHFIKLGNAYADKETALTMGIDCIYYD